jgi:hypothetical protein
MRGDGRQSPGSRGGAGGDGGRRRQWSQEAHERAIKEAGFRAFAWHPSKVSPEDVAYYGEEYWRDLYDNCLVIGLVCQK